MLISDRIKEICKERGISLSKIEKEIGLGNGTIGKWGKNGRTPTYDRISAVAEYLGVSVSDLTGEEEIKNPASTTADGWEKEAIQLLSSLSLEARARELAYLREIVGEQDTKTAPHPKDT